MKTPDQCRAKAVDLEREAKASKSDVRRKAFLELADHWRRLADSHARLQEEAMDMGPWVRRRSRVN